LQLLTAGVGPLLPTQHSCFDGRYRGNSGQHLRSTPPSPIPRWRHGWLTWLARLSH